MSDRVADAHRRADERRARRADRLRPLGWAILALVWASAATNDPAPGLHGRGAWVLVVLCAYTAPLTLAVRPTPLTAASGARAAVVALLGAAGVALAALQPDDPGTVAPSVAVFIAAAALPVVAASVVVVAITAGLDLTLAIAAHASGQSIVATTLLCVVLALAAWLMRRAGESQERTEVLYAELQDARDSQAQAAAIAERGRIAGELHDVLAHSLSGAAIQLQGARRLMERGPADPAAAAAVERASELVKDGLADARRAVSALRGEELPTVDRLPALVDDLRRDLAMEVSYDVRGAPRALSTEASLALYRGAQEALTNAARHAPGAAVTVTLVHGETSTALTVENRGGERGNGLADVGGGYGLAGMRERIERVGGTMSAGPTADGWRVSLEVAQ